MEIYASEVHNLHIEQIDDNRYRINILLMKGDEPIVVEFVSKNKITAAVQPNEMLDET